MPACTQKNTCAFLPASYGGGVWFNNTLEGIAQEKIPETGQDKARPRPEPAAGIGSLHAARSRNLTVAHRFPASRTIGARRVPRQCLTGDTINGGNRMAHVTKPQGGYRLLSIDHLCAAWCAYKSRELSWLGFRVFLGLHEVAERRKVASLQETKRGEGLWRDTVVLELQLLVRCARASQVRAALAQLERVGLLRQKDGRVELKACVELGRQARDMAARISRRGTIPVPRQALRYLAAGGSTAVVAYMLGITIRCCHVRAGGEFNSRGRCSIRFVAELFGLDVRTVKRAAATVVPLGWMEKDRATYRWTRRHGSAVRVNTQWRGPDTESPPRRSENSTKSPPPIKKQELLTDPKNQEPSVVPTANQPKPEVAPSNALRSLSIKELRDPDRLMLRFRRAVEVGLAADCPASRLRFFAAAQHALRVATRNPCGLFVTVVRQSLWRFVSQADEDRAQAMLRRAAGDSRQRQPTSASNKPLDRLITDLVEKVCWPAAQRVANSCTAPAICSKKHASPVSLAAASSSPIARSESVTDVTLSIRAARNLAYSSRESVYGLNLSMT